MKNITLSAEESLISEARDAARASGTSLNELFRQWLAEIAGRRERSERLDALLDRIGYAKAGRRFSRDEMNER